MLDVGCGTGVLSCFAARAGAAKVIGVDRSDIVVKAREVVRDNGFDGIITLLQVRTYACVYAYLLIAYNHRAKWLRLTCTNALQRVLDEENLPTNAQNTHRKCVFCKTSVRRVLAVGAFRRQSTCHLLVCFARVRWCSACSVFPVLSSRFHHSYIFVLFPSSSLGHWPG